MSFFLIFLMFRNYLVDRKNTVYDLHLLKPDSSSILKLSTIMVNRSVMMFEYTLHDALRRHPSSLLLSQLSILIILKIKTIKSNLHHPGIFLCVRNCTHPVLYFRGCNFISLTFK